METKQSEIGISSFEEDYIKKLNLIFDDNKDIILWLSATKSVFIDIRIIQMVFYDIKFKLKIVRSEYIQEKKLSENKDEDKGTPLNGLDFSDNQDLIIKIKHRQLADIEYKFILKTFFNYKYNNRTTLQQAIHCGNIQLIKWLYSHVKSIEDLLSPQENILAEIIKSDCKESSIKKDIINFFVFESNYAIEYHIDEFLEILPDSPEIMLIIIDVYDQKIQLCKDQHFQKELKNAKEKFVIKLSNLYEKCKILLHIYNKKSTLQDVDRLKVLSDESLLTGLVLIIKQFENNFSPLIECLNKIDIPDSIQESFLSQLISLTANLSNFSDIVFWIKKQYINKKVSNLTLNSVRFDNKIILKLQEIFTYCQQINLESLILNGCEFLANSKNSFYQLCCTHLPNILVLKFINSGICDDDLVHKDDEPLPNNTLMLYNLIYYMPKLTHLYLDDNGITEASITPGFDKCFFHQNTVTDHKQLKYISLKNNHISLPSYFFLDEIPLQRTRIKIDLGGNELIRHYDSEYHTTHTSYRNLLVIIRSLLIEVAGQLNNNPIKQFFLELGQIPKIEVKVIDNIIQCWIDRACITFNSELINQIRDEIIIQHFANETDFFVLFIKTIINFIKKNKKLEIPYQPNFLSLKDQVFINNLAQEFSRECNISIPTKYYLRGHPSIYSNVFVKYSRIMPGLILTNKQWILHILSHGKLKLTSTTKSKLSILLTNHCKLLIEGLRNGAYFLEAVHLTNPENTADILIQQQYRQGEDGYYYFKSPEELLKREDICSFRISSEIGKRYLRQTSRDIANPSRLEKSYKKLQFHSSGLGDSTNKNTMNCATYVGLRLKYPCEIYLDPVWSIIKNPKDIVPQIIINKNHFISLISGKLTNMEKPVYFGSTITNIFKSFASSTTNNQHNLSKNNAHIIRLWILNSQSYNNQPIIVHISIENCYHYVSLWADFSEISQENINIDAIKLLCEFSGDLNIKADSTLNDSIYGEKCSMSEFLLFSNINNNEMTLRFSKEKNSKSFNIMKPNKECDLFWGFTINDSANSLSSVVYRLLFPYWRKCSFFSNSVQEVSPGDLHKLLEDLVEEENKTFSGNMYLTKINQLSTQLTQCRIGK